MSQAVKSGEAIVPMEAEAKLESTTAEGTVPPTAAVGAPGPLVRLPDKLMDILMNEEAPEAIWWLQNGTAFAMQNEKFQEQILDKHFRGNKFKSLVRNLHRWYVVKVFLSCISHRLSIGHIII